MALSRRTKRVVTAVVIALVAVVLAFVTSGFVASFITKPVTEVTERAKELDCTVALYGHTHRAFNETVDGVLCVNPGSAGDYASPSYCYLALHNGKATAVIVNL